MITILLPLVLSATFGQLGRPLFEETFFTLHIQQCNSLLENSFNMFLHYVFQTPLEFLLCSGVDLQKSEVTLLSDIRQRPVFPDVQNFCLGLLPHPMPNTNVLTRQSLA